MKMCEPIMEVLAVVTTDPSGGFRVGAAGARAPPCCTHWQEAPLYQFQQSLFCRWSLHLKINAPIQYTLRYLAPLKEMAYSPTHQYSVIYLAPLMEMALKIYSN